MTTRGHYQEYLQPTATICSGAVWYSRFYWFQISWGLNVASNLPGPLFLPFRHWSLTSRKQAPQLTQQTALMIEHWWKSFHTYSKQEDFTKNSWCLVDSGTCSLISLSTQAHNTFLFSSTIANPCIFAHLGAFQCIWSFHLCINSHMYSSHSCI